MRSTNTNSRPSAASHLHCHFLPPAAVANKTQFLLPRTLSARAWLGSKSKLSALNFIFFTQFLLFFLARRCAHQKKKEHCGRPLSFLIWKMLVGTLSQSSLNKPNVKEMAFWPLPSKKISVGCANFTALASKRFWNKLIKAEAFFTHLHIEWNSKFKL